MNPLALQVMAVFGTLLAIVIVILAIPYLSPYAGSASAGLESTGTQYGDLLPFIGAIIAGGIALAALSGRRH